jgi:uncharacterized protein YdaU (DUF1376 family)
MSLAEEGAYRRLLDYCWLQGSLPNDMAKLAKLCRTTPKHMAEMWPAIEPCLYLAELGVWKHKRLEKERAKQDAYRARSAEGGRKSGEVRRAQAAAKQQHTKGTSVLVEPNANQTRTKTKSSSSSSTASSTSVTTSTAYSAAFTQVWQNYPKRNGGNPKKRAFAAWKARVREGHTTEVLSAGVERYRAWCIATDKLGTELVMQAARFFGPDEYYLDEWTPPRKEPAAALRGFDGEWQPVIEERKAKPGEGGNIDFGAYLPGGNA